MNNFIPLVKPFLPQLHEYTKLLEQIWDNRILSNRGPFHEQLKDGVKKYLKVDYVYPYVNGTTALEIAIKMLGIKNKEIITTPFTYVATILAILNTDNIPVFCDVNEKGNIDENLIEGLITEKTAMILPVHVYGQPVNIDKINSIAKKHDLFVVYDAAHAFGVEIDKIGIGNFGDISMFSSHATKVFHTIEGGFLSYNNPEMDRIAHLSCNFGLGENYDLVYQGSNGKMNELQAAMGLLQLKYLDENIRKRKTICDYYRDQLPKEISVTDFNDIDIKYNYQYYIIKHKDRDKIHDELLRKGIATRKYFYPIATQYSLIQSKIGIKSFPIAEKLSREVLAIPLYSELDKKSLTRIVSGINKLIKDK